MLYILAMGNEGGYPKGKNGFTKYAERSGFKTVYHDDKTDEYLYYSEIMGKCYRYGMAKVSLWNKVNIFVKHMVMWMAHPNYIETLLCYWPHYMSPRLLQNAWIWQFRKYPKESPVNLYWTIFDK